MPKPQQPELFHKEWSKRRPGFNEYIDELSRLRTHKGRITPEQIDRIRRRKLLQGVKFFTIPEIKPSSYALPSIELIIGEKHIGNISRGHRNITEFGDYRGKGIFRKAMQQLEKWERNSFKHGLYKKYLEELSKEIVHHARPGALEFVKSLPKNNHIDFTSIPNVAARLMELGYELTPQDLKAVHSWMPTPYAGREKVITFLKYISRERMPLLFILYKPAKNE